MKILTACLGPGPSWLTSAKLKWSWWQTILRSISTCRVQLLKSFHFLNTWRISNQFKVSGQRKVWWSLTATAITVTAATELVTCMEFMVKTTSSLSVFLILGSNSSLKESTGTYFLIVSTVFGRNLYDFSWESMSLSGWSYGQVLRTMHLFLLFLVELTRTICPF